MSIKILDRPVFDYVTTPVLGECLPNKLMSVFKESIWILDISSIGTWLRDYGLFESVPIQNLGRSEFDYVLGECLFNKVMYVYKEYIWILDISIGTWLRDYSLFERVPTKNFGQCLKSVFRLHLI